MKWETKTHTLLCPIDFETGEGDDATTVKIEKVKLSTPKGKEMRRITRLVAKAEVDPLEYSEMDMMIDAMQIMSDAPEGAFDEMHASDIVLMANLAGPFLETVMGGGALSEKLPSGTATTKTS